ncbi:MAG: hypothetical protein WDW38_010469 [Sanguina aurantia]
MIKPGRLPTHQGLISTPLSTHQGQARSAAAAAGQGLRSSSSNRAAVGVAASGWREQAELEAAAVEELDDAGKALRIIMDGARSHGKLDLTDFRLQALPEEVWDIDGLEELSATGNCLASLPDSISRLTALKRLGLAGNLLTSLPDSIGSLAKLEGLWLHGNMITELPESIGGLWKAAAAVTGSWAAVQPAALLIPAKRLLYGNCLTAVPSSISRLTALADLNLSGNSLCSLPPTLGNLPSLKHLALNGNALTRLEEGLLSGCGAVTELLLMGNQLATLPESIGALTVSGREDVGPASDSLGTAADSDHGLLPLPLPLLLLLPLPPPPPLPPPLPPLLPLPLLPPLLQLVRHDPGADESQSSQALQELSVADNRLQQLPASFGALTALHKLYLYGNRLTSLPSTLTGCTSLRTLWLESNPLSGPGLAEVAAMVAPLTGLSALGLDTAQAELLTPEAVTALGSRLKAAPILGHGPGYFKLQLGPCATHTAPYVGSSGRGGANSGDSSSNGGTISSSSSSSEHSVLSNASDSSVADSAGSGSCAGLPTVSALAGLSQVLVVAFGSAPGLPNWGGMLGRMYSAAKEDSHRSYDVLYVVDPSRLWYEGGDAATFQRLYYDRLRRYTRRYSHVVMVGDSMGASAALMCSPLATAVLAFCPQVDLATSSIRPARSPAWQQSLGATLLAAVEESTADITVFTGTWQHDIDQVHSLPKKVRHTIFPADSHRLALHLERQGKLMPIVQEVLLQQMGVIQKRGVRLHNLV